MPTSHTLKADALPLHHQGSIPGGACNFPVCHVLLQLLFYENEDKNSQTSTANTEQADMEDDSITLRLDEAEMRSVLLHVDAPLC